MINEKSYVSKTGNISLKHIIEKKENLSSNDMMANIFDSNKNLD
jgi:hypothetical protein